MQPTPFACGGPRHPWFAVRRGADVGCSRVSAGGGVAEWLCSGLQSRGRRFDSDPRLTCLSGCAHLDRPGPKSMTIRIVRLGTARAPGEGPRIGTVRRPPRGVPKAKFASENWYDVWLPNLAPLEATVKLGQRAASAREWAVFARRYRTEMAAPATSRVLD